MEVPVADISLTATPYNGSLLAADLLSSSQTLVLSSFGSPQTATLTDADGWLEDADDGVSTYDGDPINYIGSGTATPGVDVGGITMPLGTSADLVVFEAGGTIYFHYPDGPPNLLDAVALVVDIDADPYQVFTPICFGEGTLIATPDGEMPVEDLEPGDEVVDCYGEVHKVLWRGGETLELPEGEAYDKWRPVRVRAHAFGPGCPSRDTFLSQQHRVYYEHPKLAAATGHHGAFAPAVHMVNNRSIRIAHGRRVISYHHVLCATHVALLANSMPAESLLLAETAPEDGTDLHMELRARFPEAAGMRPAAPILRRDQSEVISEHIANQSPLLPASVKRRLLDKPWEPVRTAWQGWEGNRL